MIESRKHDTQPYSSFRSDRFFQVQSPWYFHTREGTVEGPFPDRREAETKLEDYIRVASSGFYVPDENLGLEPMKPTYS